MVVRSLLIVVSVASIALACGGGESAHPPEETTAVATFTTGSGASSDASTGDTSATDASIDAAPPQDAALGYPLNGPIPACSWPADMNPPDAAPGWHVARFWLSCQDGNGTEICLSDVPTTCPGPNAIPGGVDTDCVDLCSPGDYALVWIVGSSPPAVPSTCWLDPELTTIGGQFACCPCE